MRAVDVQSRRLSAEHSVTGPQVICLLTLADDGPMTATALAKLVHLSNSTVVGILDRLEQKAWIARERSTTDRRQVLVNITDPGRELLGRVPQPLQERLARGLDRLPPREQLELATAIERICELLEVPDDGAAPLLEARPIEESLGSPDQPTPEGDADDASPRRHDQPPDGPRHGPGRAPGDER